MIPGSAMIIKDDGDDEGTRLDCEQDDDSNHK